MNEHKLKKKKCRTLEESKLEDQQKPMGNGLEYHKMLQKMYFQ